MGPPVSGIVVVVVIITTVGHKSLQNDVSSPYKTCRGPWCVTTHYRFKDVPIPLVFPVLVLFVLKDPQRRHIPTLFVNVCKRINSECTGKFHDNGYPLHKYLPVGLRV